MRARATDWAGSLQGRADVVAFFVVLKRCRMGASAGCVRFAPERERDRTIQRLGCALQAGFAPWDWIGHGPDLDSLWQDPRFQALLPDPEKRP